MMASSVASLSLNWTVFTTGNCIILMFRCDIYNCCQKELYLSSNLWFINHILSDFAPFYIGCVFPRLCRLRPRGRVHATLTPNIMGFTSRLYRLFAVVTEQGSINCVNICSDTCHYPDRFSTTAKTMTLAHICTFQVLFISSFPIEFNHLSNPFSPTFPT